MPSKTTTLRLGERADEHLERLSSELALTRADAVRVALAALDRDAELKEEIATVSAARRIIECIREAAGTSPVRLHLKTDPMLASLPVTIYARRNTVELEDVHVYAIARHGRTHFDLYSAHENVTIASVAITDSGEAAIPLDAIHIDTPVPPIEGQATVQLADGRTQVTVWDDGTPKSYVLGEEPLVEPNRNIHRGEPRE